MVGLSSNSEWLDLLKEEIIEPDLPICDPHHHLWDRNSHQPIQPRYLLDEILDDIYNGGRCTDCGDDNPLQAAVEQCCPRPQGSKNSSQMWGIDQFDITILNN